MLFYRLFLYLILSIAILHRLISPFFLLLLLSPIIHTTQSPLHPRPPRPPSYSPNTTCFHLITPTKHSPSLCSAHTLPLTTFTFLFSSPIPLQDQLYPLAVYVFFSTPILLLTYSYLSAYFFLFLLSFPYARASQARPQPPISSSAHCVGRVRCRQKTPNDNGGK